MDSVQSQIIPGSGDWPLVLGVGIGFVLEILFWVVVIVILREVL